MAADSRAKKAAAGDDGSATERTYMRAVELMRDGHSGKAAFEQIAAETGESAGTVQARYYRVARKAGEVQRRPRSQDAVKKNAAPKARVARDTSTAVVATVPAVSTSSVAAQLDTAAKLLQQAAGEIRSLESDAAKWRQIRPLLDAR